MNDKGHIEQPEQPAGLKLGDIYYILFRQKWVILLFSAVGLVGGVTLLLRNPPIYQSEAKLFIRYVVTGKSLNAPGNDQDARPLNDQGQSIIATEVEILSSFDLARQAAEAVGPERILPRSGGAANLDQAAKLVMRGLVVDPLDGRGSVLFLIFQHPDPEIAQEVLSKVINVYYKKHREAHQPVGVFGSFLAQETERLHNQLAETDQQLREAKTKAGVTSVADARKAITDQSSRVQMDLYNAEAELAGHQALLAPAVPFASGNGPATNVETQIPSDRIDEYKRVCTRLEMFRKREQEFQLSFTETNTLVREVQETIAEIEKRKSALQQAYPMLGSMVIALPTQPGQSSGATANAGAGLQAKALKLKSQLHQIQEGAAKLDEMETKILDLQRKKDLQEADLKYFSAKLEQGKIDEALGTGQAPNIDIVDPPTPAVRARPKTFKKKLGMVVVGPVLGGIALAFLIEMFLDSTIKRPAEVETKLHLPLFMSIPDLRKNGRGLFGRTRRQGTSKSKDAPPGDGGLALAPWEATNPLHRFYEGLRDRLIVYFEIKNLVHKPKLMAVTSCGPGAGVTSLAAGLAAALSQTGDGKVLFVDMNPEQQGAAQLFYKGEPGCGLEEALESETKESALVDTNLYVAAERVGSDNLPRVLPKRFTQLMPKFRASDYDYIIFDMPPTSQTSVTPRLAGMMDMVLLVVESEKTSQEVVQQANALLAASKANVGVVLNKTHSYVPARLHQELPDVT